MVIVIIVNIIIIIVPTVQLCLPVVVFFVSYPTIMLPLEKRKTLFQGKLPMFKIPYLWQILVLSQVSKNILVKIILKHKA